VSDIFERWRSLWDHMSRGPMPQPTFGRLADGRVLDGDGTPAGPLRSGEDYCEVVLDEVFLPNGRSWLTTYDPMVLVVTELAYDHVVQPIPCVVGPAMVERYGGEAPHGMRFSRVRVAGLHPYAGAGLSLTIVLYRVPRANVAADLLRLVERAAALVPAATALTTYLKVGELVLDGVERLTGLDDTEPVLGVRHEISGADLRPSSFALASADPGAPFWVRDGRLMAGPTSEQAVPYETGEHLLVSVRRQAARDDETTLAFYPLFEELLAEAADPSGDAWKSVQNRWVELARELLRSPDLTEPQKDELYERFRERLRVEHKRAVTPLGPGADGSDATDVRVRSLSLTPLEA
jgi:hypothetical protein